MSFDSRSGVSSQGSIPPSGSEAGSAENPIDQLAERFLEEYRSGQSPAISDFVQRNPELEDEIRDLFPALLWMEQLAPQPQKRRHTALPRRLGDYRILRETGRGGMGVVFEAVQEQLGRRVALKVLPWDVSADHTLQKRFHREARSAARLQHRNIVPIFDVGEHDNIHYYSMQFIDGSSCDSVLKQLRRAREFSRLGRRGRPPRHGIARVLERFLRREADASMSRSEPMPGGAAEGEASQSVSRQSSFNLLGESDEGSIALELEPSAAPAADTAVNRGPTDVAVPDQSDLTTIREQPDRYWMVLARIGISVAEALDYAHSQGILHRDIKPSNLMLDRKGTVWVTDFGLARAEEDEKTGSGRIMGTLRYLAPERMSGQTDGRSDIYSLGLTLYEFLALRPAFTESDRARLVKLIAETEPPRPRRIDPSVPVDLETIVLKAMEKDPARRYQAAGELAADLTRFLEGRSVSARRVLLPERLLRWCRRNSSVAALSAAVGLLLVLLTLEYSGFRVRHPIAASIDSRPEFTIVSPDGRWIATSTAHELQVVAADTRERVARQKPCRNLCFAGAGRLLIVCRETEVDLVATSNWETLRTFEIEYGSPSLAVASTNGRYAAFAESTRSVTIVDLGAVSVHQREALPPYGKLTSLAFSNDSERLFAASETGFLETWHVRSHKTRP